MDRSYRHKKTLMKVLLRSKNLSDFSEELEILDTQREIQHVNAYFRTLNSMVSFENLTSFYPHFLSIPNLQSNNDTNDRKSSEFCDQIRKISSRRY